MMMMMMMILKVAPLLGAQRSRCEVQVDSSVKKWNRGLWVAKSDH